MRNKYILLIAGILFPLCLNAQDADFRSRTSISADLKICKRLHLNGEYELRTADMFSRIERHQVSLGIDWSPVKHLDLGAGYCFIGHYNSDNEFKPRNRFYFDMGTGYKFGPWKLSLKEHLQLTCKSYDINAFQQNPNLLELKSRLKLSYKGFVHMEPYAYAELRNCFNAPSFIYEYDASEDEYDACQFKGYGDAYVNRLRAAAGVQWDIDRHNAIDFRFMTDWCSDKDIDSNSDGTELKKIQWEKSIVCSLAVGYVFSF